MMIHSRFRFLFFSLALGMLWIALVGFSGCATTGSMSLPEHRPADFTLGVVVFGDDDASDVSHLSARYIVDAAGNLRASVGAGSSARTYPPIIRQLSDEQLDEIWEKGSTMIRNRHAGGSGAGSGFWTEVDSPEQFDRDDFSTPGGGYLLEIRANGKLQAWESYMFLGGPTSFVDTLADLAWIREQTISSLFDSTRK